MSQARISIPATMKLFLITVLLLTVIVATAGNYPQQKTWEYKVESGVDAKKLNSLATEGWEVVTTGNYGGSLSAPYVILKRAR